MNKHQPTTTQPKTEGPTLKDLFTRLERNIRPYTFADPYEFAQRDAQATLKTIDEMQQALGKIKDLVLLVEGDQDHL